MIKHFTFFLAVAISATSFAQIEDRTETNCDGESRSVYEVAETGIPIIVASKGFDCGICINQADNVAEFADEYAGTVQVWGAMKYTYSSATPNCGNVEQWVNTHDWDNVFSFVDLEGYWASFGTPFYQVIDPNTLEIIYDGPSWTNATAFALDLAPLSASNVVLNDDFLIFTNREKINLHFAATETLNAYVEVHNIVGQVIEQYPIQIIAGRNEVILPFQAVEGIYVASIVANEQRFTTKFVNQN